MGRIPLLILGGLLLCAAAPLQAELIGEFDDFVYLHDHETVRYRLDIDYGSGSQVDVDIFVRGIYEPPRVRVLDSDRDEVKDERDTSGDYILDFDFLAKLPHETYYIEVDSAHPWSDSEFDVFIEVYAPATDNASAEIRFDKFYYDYETGDDSDHYDCSTHAGSGGWPLAALAVTVVGALWFRQRRAHELEKQRT